MPSIDRQEIVVDLQGVGVALVKHLGLHKGHFQVAVGFRLGVGGIPGEPDGKPIPGAMVGVENISLVPVDATFQGPNVVNAAEVNPARKPAGKKPAVKQRSA
jgi:hypothetical protein